MVWVDGDCRCAVAEAVVAAEGGSCEDEVAVLAALECVEFVIIVGGGGCAWADDETLAELMFADELSK